MLRADQYPLIARVYVERDGARRLVGQVELGPDGSHRFYGGEADDGAREVQVAPGGTVIVDEHKGGVWSLYPRPSLQPRRDPLPDPDYDRHLARCEWRRESDGDLGDIAANRRRRA